MGLLDGAPAFPMIAVRAGSHQIGPHMLASQMAGDDMVNGEIRHVLAAILASVVIATQDLTLGKFDARAGSVDHPFQAND